MALPTYTPIVATFEGQTTQSLFNPTASTTPTAIAVFTGAANRNAIASATYCLLVATGLFILW
jgi:hypothetical protein